MAPTGLIYSKEKYILNFRKPSGTSRGTLTEKASWLIRINDPETGITGLGECSLLPGLSPEYKYDFEGELSRILEELNCSGETPDLDYYAHLPALRFGLESAWLDLKMGGNGVLFDNAFSRGEKGIPINGLVWMGSTEDMIRQAREKVEAGFPCVKFKVGALDFEEELRMLKKLRNDFGQNLEIRLDANGAFTAQDAREKLDRLSEFQIHSIEQPIKPGQVEAMAQLCASSPIPIALDEELIGHTEKIVQTGLLQTIKPQYIILKPSLLGGLQASAQWITIAEGIDIQWWATSALESNIGLNAIAQWTAEYDTILPQGLGTGGLFTNNIPAPLEVKSGELWRI